MDLDILCDPRPPGDIRPSIDTARRPTYAEYSSRFPFFLALPEVCMTARLTTLFAAMLLASACAPDRPGTDAAADPAAADRTAIEQLRADYVTHYNQQHASIVADMFTDSAFALYADGQVHLMKPAILAGLEAELVGKPTLGIETGDIMVFGDNAVARGAYTVSATPPGAPAPINFAGNYLAQFRKVNGAWKINGVATNFNAPPPEGVMSTDTTQTAPPPDEGTMKALGDAFAAAVAARDWNAIANLYTDSAVVGFSEAPLVEGRAAILSRFNERFGAVTESNIEIHDVGTLDFGNGWAIDGGWFVFNITAPAPTGKMTQPGAYLNLLQQQPDGSWKIHWSISNGQPRPAT
jgi:ketosteroid isomerase-like protein